MAATLLNSLGPQTVERLGGRTAALEFMGRITRTSLNPRYVETVNQAECYYAQRVMNDIVLARMTTHRRNGVHTLDANLADRFISPTEELNLIENNEFLFSNIIGSEGQPLRGAWTGVLMRQLLSEFNPVNLNYTDEATRIQVVQQTRTLALLVVATRPQGPSEAIDMELRARVRTVAFRFAQEWNRIPPERAKLLVQFREAQENEQAVNKQHAPAIKLATAQLEKANADAKKLREERLKKIAALGPPTKESVEKMEQDAKAITDPAQQEVDKARAPVLAAEAQVKTIRGNLNPLEEEWKKHADSLRTTPSFSQGTRDIISTMRLLRMSGNIDDNRILFQLNSILGGSSESVGGLPDTPSGLAESESGLIDNPPGGLPGNPDGGLPSDPV